MLYANVGHLLIVVCFDELGSGQAQPLGGDYDSRTG